MAKHPKKKRRKTAQETVHPTIFVFEGDIKYYEEGSMLSLNMQVTPEEWNIILNDTVKYSVFVNCLKNVAFPILHEKWEKLDEWYRLQLEVAVSRIRNIDPIAVAAIDIENLQKVYSAKMENNANEMVKTIKTMRQTQQEFDSKSLEMIVSDL